MMRYLLLLLLSLLSGAASAQELKAARMVFEATTHDFGRIQESDGDVSCTFRFRNDGSLPLVINSVGVSCGCTTPRFSREPLLPGKSGEMEVTFDPTNRPGRFEKVINILCNDPRRSIRLTITGDVVPKPRTIQDDYPYHLSDGLRIADRSLVIGTLPHGTGIVRSVGVANGGKTPVSLSVDGAGLPTWLSVRPRKATLAPGERSEIEMTMNAPVDLWGRQAFTYGLVVNGARQAEPVEGNVIFTEDFGGWTKTALQMAPRADYSSFYYHFSDQPRGKSLSRQFQITNGGRSDLLIRHIGTTGSRIRATSDKSVIKAGDTATLTVTLDTKGASGRVSEGVTVVTNDPERPARDLRVQANIVE